MKKILYFVLAISLLAGIVLMSAGCSKTTTKTTTTPLPPGTPTAMGGDTVNVDYTLKLANGTVYQTTVGTGSPFSFELGVGQVIPGFDAAVNGMAVGQTKTVKIAAKDAYGTQKSASNPLAGQNLTFVITLLQIQPTIARAGFNVQVDYTLKLADVTVSHTTVGTGTPFSFTLGAGQVIEGFDNAVTGMNVGETKTVTIPAAQAYGAAPSASNPLAGQDLTFTITMLAIHPAK